MQPGRSRDIAAGAVLLAAGLFFAGFALAQLKLGSFAKMGPGMFPTLIGAVLCLTGLGQIAAALTRPRPDEAVEPVEWRALVSVIAAMVAFAVVVAWLGVVPGIFALTAVAAFASPKLKPLPVLLLAIGLSFAAWAIFIKTLGLPFPLFKWPF